jgi:hypothetical protein
MIAEIQAIMCLLASDPLTVDTVVRKLGTVTDNYSGNVLIKPYDPQFKEASVVREIDQTTGKHLNIPSLVDLTPVNPPKVETLVQAFGAYKRGAPNRHLPPRINFYLDMPGHPYKIVLGADIKGNHAIRIILRRDKRS